jgi:hypothetical protein
MKKIVIFSLCLFLSCGFCFAQDTVKLREKFQHSLFLELGGNSVYFYNITYDCSFQLKEKHKIAIGVGFQYFPVDVPWLMYPHTFGASIQVNYLYEFKRNHHLETGLGITLPWFACYDL